TARRLRLRGDLDEIKPAIAGDDPATLGRHDAQGGARLIDDPNAGRANVAVETVAANGAGAIELA
ncbi:MAG: hypothetical protein ACI9U2_002214, partial [Bradymonadia bacterium]